MRFAHRSSRTYTPAFEQDFFPLGVGFELLLKFQLREVCTALGNVYISLGFVLNCRRIRLSLEFFTSIYCFSGGKSPHRTHATSHIAYHVSPGYFFNAHRLHEKVARFKWPRHRKRTSSTTTGFEKLKFFREKVVFQTSNY